MLFQRLAGIGGLIIPLAVIVTTVVDRPPAFDASAAEILEYYSSHEGRIHFLWVLNLLFIPGMALFTAGMASVLRPFEQRSGEHWSASTRVAVTSIFIALAVSGAITGVLSSHADAMRSEPALVTSLWQLNLFAFILAPIGMSVAIGSLAFGVTRAGLVRRRLGIAACVVEVWFLAAAILVAATHWGDGPTIAFAAMIPGFVGNLIIVTAFSVRLIRKPWGRTIESGAEPAPAPAAAESALTTA